MSTLRILIICLLFTVFMPFDAFGSATITVTGGWNDTINSSDLIGGAGTDLAGTCPSPSNASYITVTTGSPDERWRVDVRRIDSTWSSQCSLWVRRTSNEPGITGGTAYQEVTTANQVFFSGQGSYTTITCEYKLEGMSIGIRPACYSTSVLYLIMNL